MREGEERKMRGGIGLGGWTGLVLVGWDYGCGCGCGYGYGLDVGLDGRTGWSKPNLGRTVHLHLGLNQQAPERQDV